MLNDPYHGTTKPYTMVNGGFGVKWMDNGVTTSVKATNIGNQDIQQHVFGDIIKPDRRRRAPREFLCAHPRGVAPRTPRHALSRAASPARSVRVAHSLRSFASLDSLPDRVVPTIG